MKKYLPTTIFIILTFLMVSCELESQELIELRNEVRYLETEISSLRNSPGFMFGDAFEFIDAKDYNEAVTLLSQLQSEFPDWNKDVVNSFFDKYSELVPDSLAAE